MNTLQIYCKLVSLRSNSTVNFDVLAIDQLNNYQIPKPYGLVINTEPSYSTKSGHWISVFNNNSEISFFDSYGFPFSYFNDSLSKYMHKEAHIILQNKVQFQSFVSDVCGEHCIYFLNACLNGVKANELEHLYSSTTNINDNLVVDFVRKIKLKCNLSNRIRGICVKESDTYLKMRSNKL
jgi:hypothetical protein